MSIQITTTCDFCKKQAIVDGKTKMRPWAYMCREHFKMYGINTKGLFTPIVKNFDEIMKEDN